MKKFGLAVTAAAALWGSCAAAAEFSLNLAPPPEGYADVYNFHLDDGYISGAGGFVDFIYMSSFASFSRPGEFEVIFWDYIPISFDIGVGQARKDYNSHVKKGFGMLLSDKGGGDYLLRLENYNHNFDIGCYVAEGDPCASFVFNERYSIYGVSSHAPTFQTSRVAVPEPSTWAMLILGFAGLGAAARRQRSRSRAVAHLGG